MVDNETTTLTNHEQQLENIIHSNHYIRRRVQESVNEFLNIRQNLLHELQTKNLNDLSNELAPLIDAMRIETLNQQVTSSKVQLALCGENSSGKTSFIHLLLGIEDILPADVGPVTARIVKMSYAKAEEACAIIYSSLEASFNETGNQDIVTNVDLSPFFVLNDEQDEPNWEGISNALAIHVRRPDGIDVHSEEFVKWAKHFVEIRLPSSTLKLGIDVYDTAGFRVRDAQVLKDCLYDLVRLVHPTLVFLFDNASSTDESNDCFLALKGALKHLDSSNIFFLNTKADIDTMPGINKVKNEVEFLAFLNAERIKRYELLLKTPGMVNGMPGGLPKSFDKCNCFDICSVNSQMIPVWGPLMNETTIRRLIQFVANSDLIMAQRVSNLVLPAIETFFDLSHITSHRTRDQLDQLRRDANHWIETYFQKHREALNKFLRDVFQNISDRLTLVKNDLARRAAQQSDSSSIQTFIQLAIRQEVMKTVVHHALDSMAKTTLDMIVSNRNLMVNATSNEFLVGVLRSEASDQIAIRNDESANAGALRYFMMQTITAPALMVTDQLHNEENDKSRNISHEKHRQQEINSTEFNPMNVAHQCLEDIQQRILASETMFGITVTTWSTRQKTKLKKQIKEQYEAAITVLPVRSQVHDVLRHYAHQFVHIECQLQAAQDLAKFNGQRPSIQPGAELTSQSPTTIYNVHEVEWGSNKKKLFVKQSTRPIFNAAYLEAHYHRKITNISVPCMIKLVYLFENPLPDRSYDLWMIFETPLPGIKRNLNHFLDEHKQQQILVPLEQILRILISVISALDGLHENELEHRNIKASNILLDEGNNTFLADLGDWCIADDDDDDHSNIAETRHNLSATPDGVNDDIKSFGELGLMLYTTIDREKVSSTVCDEFKQLMEKCSKARCNESIKAADIRQKLKYQFEKVKRS